MSFRKAWIPAAAVSLTLVQTQAALAHPGHPGHAFADGWWHPLLGLDHLLAMVAVGLLAVRLGGRGLWLMPAMFVSAMVGGGIIAASGVALPGVEWGIMASVLVLGALIAASWRMPLPAGAALVSLFAVFHGYAHAAEMVAGGSLSVYAAGFVSATALLHLAGIAAGTLLAQTASARPLRMAGGAISAASLLMALGAI